MKYIPLIGQNHSLSLTSLSMKLLTLLAFTRPSKSYDLFSHGLTYMITLPDSVESSNSHCLAKQSRPSRPAVPFVFPASQQMRIFALKKHYLNEYLCEFYRNSESNSTIIPFHPSPLPDRSWPC